MRGSALEAVTDVALRGHGAIPEGQSREFANQLFPVAQKRGYNEINNAVRPIETKALRAWAEGNRMMLDNADFSRRWEEQGKRGGAEQDVFHNPADDRWYKRNVMSFHSQYLEYFHRLALHHWLFPDTAYRFEGFVHHDGKLEPVTSQPNVKAARGARPKEIDKHMEAIGFSRLPEEIPGKLNTTFVNAREGKRPAPRPQPPAMKGRNNCARQNLFTKCMTASNDGGNGRKEAQEARKKESSDYRLF